MHNLCDTHVNIHESGQKVKPQNRAAHGRAIPARKTQNRPAALRRTGEGQTAGSSGAVRRDPGGHGRHSRMTTVVPLGQLS